MAFGFKKKTHARRAKSLARGGWDWEKKAARALKHRQCAKAGQSLLVAARLSGGASSEGVGAGGRSIGSAKAEDAAVKRLKSAMARVGKCYAQRHHKRKRK